MTRLVKQKQGYILIVSFVIIVVLIILTGAFLTFSINEKRNVDRQKFSLQGLYLAETAINHGLSELKNRIRVTLYTNIEGEMGSGQFEDYVNAGEQGSVDLLEEQAGFNEDDNTTEVFLILSDTGDVSPLDLSAGIQGSYSAEIRVRPNGLPSIPSKDIYTFPYTYTITGSGQISETTPVILKNLIFQGDFVVTIERTNLARFALHTDKQCNEESCEVENLVWFTDITKFTGPVSSNGRFNFYGNPAGTFTDEVTQQDNKAYFFNKGGKKLLLDADRNADIDVPLFNKGFTRGIAQLEVQSLLTKEDVKKESLGGTATAPSAYGTYLASSGTVLIGGIFVQGDAKITMSTDAENKAVYTIVATESGKSKTQTVKIDYVTNQTTIQASGEPAPTVYSGIPDGVSNEGILIYTDDKITNVSGMVQEDTKLTVASDTDVVITNNITYEEYTPGSTPSAEGYTNILGIVSFNGNVRIGETAPNDVQIHASIFAPKGVFTVDKYGNEARGPRGTATLLGGAITHLYGGFGTKTGKYLSGYGRNFVYDERMKEGYSPPYFPLIRSFQSSEEGLGQKPIWREGTQE